MFGAELLRWGQVPLPWEQVGAGEEGPGRPPAGSDILGIHSPECLWLGAWTDEAGLQTPRHSFALAAWSSGHSLVQWWAAPAATPRCLPGEAGGGGTRLPDRGSHVDEGSPQAAVGPLCW